MSEKFDRAAFGQVDQKQNQQEVSAKEGLEDLAERHRKETENFHAGVEREKKGLETTKQEMMGQAQLEALFTTIRKSWMNCTK